MGVFVVSVIQCVGINRDQDCVSFVRLALVYVVTVFCCVVAFGLLL